MLWMNFDCRIVLWIGFEGLGKPTHWIYRLRQVSWLFFGIRGKGMVWEEGEQLKLLLASLCPSWAVEGAVGSTASGPPKSCKNRTPPYGRSKGRFWGPPNRPPCSLEIPGGIVGGRGNRPADRPLCFRTWAVLWTAQKPPRVCYVDYLLVGMGCAWYSCVVIILSI